MNRSYLPIYIRVGLLGGFLYAGLSFSLYLVEPKLYVNPIFKLLPLLSVVFTMLYAIQKRMAFEDYNDIVYRDLVQAAFVSYVICELIFQGYTYALHNHWHFQINPDLGTMSEFLKQTKIAIEEAKYARDGATEMEYEIMRAHIEAEDHSLPLGRILEGYMRWLFGGFLFSFILAMFGMSRVKSLRNN